MAVRKVLVAVDGSPNSLKAVDVAASICEKYGAELVVLHVIQQPAYIFGAPAVSPSVLKDYYDTARREGERFVSEAVSKAERYRVSVRAEILERAPSVVEAITQYAENNSVELIVVGTRGLTGFKKLLMGSVASGVVSHAHCSVLVVR
ncbi:TRAP-T-associated universal stress protein TeaD [archaeon HR01]|nr:TRAP-T-associated universal stress protein TeaD [archaeon HR01]